jgi:hypothetical protein
MPFCPKCRYEYLPGVNTCPDCNEKLVASLPEPEADDADRGEPEYKDWVQLARLTSYEYTRMIQEVFTERGIPIVIHSGTGHFGQTGQMGMSSFRPVGGGYSIMVPLEFVTAADREAEAILGDTWRGSRLVDFDDR